MIWMLTADEMAGACVLVTFCAAVVDLIPIALVCNTVGVAERDFTFGELVLFKGVRLPTENVVYKSRTVSLIFWATGEPFTRTAMAATAAKRVDEKNILDKCG